MTQARFGLLAYPGIANLGDPIQSLAARQFLPRVDALIPRERISAPLEGGPLRTILNGWFMHKPSHWPPHPAIAPLLISMHFVPAGVSHLRRWATSPIDRMLSGPGADYLRRWGPVGARDPGTLEQLEARGIPAWHSGCLTLTLSRPNVAPSGDIVASDLSPAALAHLRRTAPGEIVVVTHLGGEALDQAAQEAAAEALLARYAAAAAVVTTRIHAALPCLALGTPVLLLLPPRPPRRVSDVAGLLHTCDERDFLRNRHHFDLAAPPPNPEAFRRFVPELEARCRAFIGAP